jgi:hypothetical protein
LTHLLTHEPRKFSDTPQEPRRLGRHWKKTVLAIVLGIAAAFAWNTATKEKLPPKEAPPVQAPKQNNLERWHPDDDGG